MLIVEDYTLEKIIGKGSFGQVYLTSKTGTNKLFATKKMPKTMVLQPKVKKYFNNEIHILENIDHPYIIKLYEIKQTINNYFLIFDFCNGGDLNHCLEKYKKKNKKPFTQEIVQHLMNQIVNGLQYLHNSKILHRDIKSDNILVHFKSKEDLQNLNLLNADIKIIDFGFARYLEDDSLAQSVLGSPLYMAPQILRKLKKLDNNNSFGYDQKADIWSLGTVCYEMLIGTPPFYAENYDDLLEGIQKGNYSIPNNLKLSKEAVSFLNGMIQYNPQSRLDINALANHDFLVKDIKSFHFIDIKKAKEKFMNKNEIVINAKEYQSIWYIFDTDNKENNNKINLEEIPNDMINDKINNKNFIGKRINKQQEDYLGDLNREMKNNNNYGDRYKNINNNINNENKDNLTLENLLDNTFNEINHDFFFMEPIFIPFPPIEETSIFQIDI